MNLGCVYFFVCHFCLETKVAQKFKTVEKKLKMSSFGENKKAMQRHFLSSSSEIDLAFCASVVLKIVVFVLLRQTNSFS